MFPNHEEQLLRLNKIEGQVKGVRKMIEDRRYCVDIVSQIKAVSSALRKVELGVLESHVRHCLRHAVEAKDDDEVSEKIDEIMKLIAKIP